ncbi:MAG: Holliday junction resolvase RuvX [Synergistales bacterium]|nr:Holliday junction resolvase RuvX [Synergistales bacterium]
MTRIMALDIGSVRIGVAVTDPLGLFAQGIGVIRMGTDWISQLSVLVDKYHPEIILIGLPIRTTGEKGPEADHVMEIRNDLEAAFPLIAFQLVDERFTTAIAEKVLIEADVPRKERRKKIDQLAASLILQHYLDSRRGEGGVP